MSTTIDSKVVEMRFDNKHFESNVQTSMSTLDKLKAKLNLSGASKGLDEVGASAKRIDLSHVGNAAETVGLKFNAMYSIADQALRNITTSAMNAGTKMIKALTLDPITTGFQEYETQINSTQTILANTQSKGSTIDDVNQALEELNAYADKTIYNFTEMTRNIGTFTAAGIDLETSTNAIQGIANLAAVSGSNAQQASTAMYQLSQALASGTVKLMDWNSVVNAGMGGQVFQDALKETARAHGIAVDEIIAEQGSFRESLKTGWLSAEVLTDTLQKFTLTTEGLTEEQIEANREMLRAKGYTEDQIEEIFELGRTATDAATKVKTFTQLWDVLKEAAQSGWSKTWKLIVGDFEQAKSLLTPLADFLTGIINKFSDWRNAILENALTKNFRELANQIKSALNPVTKTIDTVKGALVDYDKLVDEIIAGKWKNAPTRWQDLAAAGYDWAHAQNLVNERLGSSVRHATTYTEAADGATKSTENAATATGDLTKENIKLIEELLKLSDAELEAKGYTKEQIKAFRELEGIAKKLGLSIGELLGNIDNIDGRWLLVESFKNIGKSLVTIFKSIGAAWNDAFGISTEEAGNKLFDLLAAFHRFSRKLVISDETAKNLTDTFRGIFAILDLVAGLVGGPIKIAFKLLTTILSMFNLDILSVTGAIGRVIASFRDWVEENNIIMKALEVLVNIIKNVVVAFWNLEVVQDIVTTIKSTFTSARDGIIGTCNDWLDSINNLVEGVSSGSITFSEAMSTFGSAVKDKLMSIPFVNTMVRWAKAFWALPEIQGYVESFKNALSNFKSTVMSKFGGGFEHIKKVLADAKNIGGDLIAGLKEGLQDGTIKIKDAVIELAKFVIDTFKNILGIHSPSTVFMAIGGFIIAGLLGGLAGGSSDITSFFQNMGDGIGNIISSIPWGNIFAAGISVGSLTLLHKMTDALGALTAPLQGVGDLLSGVGTVLTKSARSIKKVIKNTAKVVKSFSKVLNSFAFKLKAEAIKSIAVAIAVLVGALLLMTLVEPKKLWNAVGALGAVVAMLIALTVVTGKFGPKEGLEFAKVGIGILAMASAILILGIAMKIMGSMKPEQMQQATNALVNVCVSMIALMASYSLLAKHGKSLDKAGSSLMAMAGSIAIMAIVVKMFARMKPEAIIQGQLAIAGLLVIMAGMMLITKLGNTKKVGTMLMQMAGALAIMAIVVKMLGNMKPEAIKQGELAIAGLLLIMAGMMLITKMGNAKKVGTMLMQMAGAMAIMAIVVALLGHMSPGAIAKGELAIAGLGAIIAGLMWTVKKFGKDAGNIGKTILMLSVSIGILAAVAVLLGFINVGNLIQGVVAVGLLAAIAAMLVKATANAQQCVGTIVALTVAIGVMALAIGLLTICDPLKLAGAVIAMGLMMLILERLIQATNNASKAMGGLIVLSICIGLLGASLLMLAKLPLKQSLGAALALTVFLLALTGSMVILSKININMGNVIKGALGLLALCVPLTALAGTLMLMKNVKNATNNAIALSVLAAALTVLLLPLSLVGMIYAATGGTAALGIAGLLGMCIPLVAIAGILCLLKNVDNAAENAYALAALMSVLGDVCVKLALVSPLAIVAAAAITILTGTLLGIGVLVAAVGALMTACPKLKEFLNNGLEVLILLAEGLGRMIGAFVEGIFTQIASSLPGIGLCLAQFMANAMVFIMGAKLVDDSVLKGVGVLTGAILALTVADVINGVTSFLKGGSSFAKLGTELSLFMANAMPFIYGAKLLKPEITESVKNLAETIKILTGAGVLDGLTKWFTGGVSLADYGKELAAFGPGIKAFADSVSGIECESVKAASEAAKNLAEMTATAPKEGGIKAWFAGESNIAKYSSDLISLGVALKAFSIAVTGINGEAIKAAAEAGTSLVDMTKSIPNEGGVLAWFAGENSLSKFSADMVKFGMALMSFSLAVTGINCEAIKAAAEAGKSITDMTNTIPNEGGVKSWFAGENSLSKFSTDLVKLGMGLLGFSVAVSGVNIAAVTPAIEAATAIANMVSIIPNEGGIKAWFAGDNSLSKFASHFPILGAGIKGFSDALVGVSVANVVAGATAALQIAQIANTMPKDSDYLYSFSINISDLGVGLTDFFGQVGSVSAATVTMAVSTLTSINTVVSTMNPSKVSSAAEAVEAIADSMKSLSKVKTSSADGFVNAIKKLADSNIEAALTKFKSAESKMKAAGTTLIKKLIEGLKSNPDGAKKAASTLASKASNGAANKENKNAFKQAGKDLAQGLINGLKDKDKLQAVYNAAYKLGQKAVQGEKDGQKSNSPSKATEQAGKWLGEGLILGIEKMDRSVYKSGRGLGETATGTISSAIARIADAVNSDIDSQPTIRPVLDLSDVTAGAGALSGLFGDQSVGVMANVGTISSMMNGRQNGVNDDVVAALNDLKKSIGNTSGDTYNFGGITYDDGSNIANMLKDLTRAVMMEGRT